MIGRLTAQNRKSICNIVTYYRPKIIIFILKYVLTELNNIKKELLFLLSVRSQIYNYYLKMIGETARWNQADAPPDCYLNRLQV